MKPPYALLSDIHFHSWSAFSRTNEDGVNSRLQIILDETLRAAKVLKDQGGSLMLIAGDLFHVRGKVQPSVLNPVFKTFQAISEMGIDVEAIAGNHDLEGNDADELGNAMQALGAIRGFTPITKPRRIQLDDDHGIMLFPWYSSLDRLMEDLREYASPDLDAVIHAPLNGVIRGIPDLGLDPEELAKLGYRRVFVGHYHHHKNFAHKVWSVGATTHQTFNDPDTLAGFCLVSDDPENNGVKHLPSHAPQFVDLKDPADIEPEVINGHYVRIKLTDVTEAEIKAFREELFKLGAAGVQINATRKAATGRTATVKAGASLEASVAEFIETDVTADHKAEIQALAAKIIAEARAS